MAREIKLTREGYERLQKALQHEQERLAEATRIVQEQMETAADYEDTGLEDAKREKMNIEARIDELEDTLARAMVMADHEADTGKAALGAIVVLLDENSKREMRVQLVSAPEASVLGGGLPKISDDSPVGTQLMGRKVGESFVVNLGQRQAKYKVKSIEY
ncbi:GreA/GreB family elongation factor [Deinococcus peraridilitoris]|uniref:Transcription elongation factor n=1 Tax=Deinococcus peraridilitoris (strain DSM 19664 / LMG 22246 / CIP 109416 / KR-200) TaxID=937777 RepID=L0A6H4_DEIPD|nr:GreA/GreB family elongation factor [Deinococcus peraridilitoris]AFZ68595.1 transcription elongation factor [Deinococcus peraridilitoris DSM 19664]